MVDSNDSRFKAISENIKKFRVQNNLTQRELAEKVGISLSYLTKIEATNCNKSFSLHVLFDIADALNVDIKEFFD
ncbi:helix-turn-helix transcriptional regulator [Tissierella creatinini]|nr:helix-turn-helix transcriptional regulator [Tissierella creatinini]TJX63947.1 helix-turn-helix transcriptional regulator [Soehngenia saccharolytica]